jgi:competence protein ComEA
VSLTASQTRGLLVLMTILLLLFAIRLALNPQKIPEGAAMTHSPSDRLADKIDPNMASESELAAIPDLGETRAAAIIEYRQNFQLTHPRGLAFQQLSDLQQIHGVGAATAENLQPYLIFPAQPRN